MTEQEYDTFLGRLDTLTSRLLAYDNQTKQDASFQDAVRSKVDELNNEAKKFGQFIANDPVLYDERADELRKALQFAPDIQNMVLPSIAIPLADTDQGASAIPAADPATTGAATSVPAAEPSQSDLDKEAKMAAFRKYMGSYDPNSSMDQAKMKVVDAALDDFKNQTGRSFNIENQDDSQIMQGIMNTAYQSPEYKSAASMGRTPTSGKRKVTSSNDQATIKFGGNDTKAFKKVGKAYIPASEEDLQSGTQVFINNPRKGQGELSKPTYVPVRMERGGARPQSKLPGILGSASNFAGDFFRSADKFSRQPRKR